jgi:hypothetical protein
MTEKAEKEVAAEKSSAISNDASGGRVPQGKGQRAFKKPIVRQPKFKGNCEDLRGHVFDCSNARQADMFSKTTKAIAGHVGKTYRYGNNVRLAVQNLTAMVMDIPKDLANTATNAQKRIWEKKINKFVKRELYFEENMQTLYSLIWGQCSDVMQARVEALSDYDTMSESGNSLALLNAIKAQACIFRARRTRQTHCTTQSADYSCCARTGTPHARCTSTASKTASTCWSTVEGRSVLTQP